jgi:diacylglycerol O-acyltransferase
MPRQLSTNLGTGLNGKAKRGERGVSSNGGGGHHPAGSGESLPNHHLTATDAAFLFLERPEIPLAIASLCIFDGPIPLREFIARVASKLPLIPRYRQIVVPQPMNVGLPTWEDDPHFDIHQHVISVTLGPPGGEAELEALAGRVFSQLMDRSKPLWDLTLIDGLEGGRGALIFRVHHALADGISGVTLMREILDPTPEGSRVIHKMPRRKKRRPSERSLADGIEDAVHSTLGSLIATEAGLFGFGQTLLSEKMQTGMRGLMGLLPELAVSVERLPFNKPCGSQRKFCWAELDFAEVHAIHKAVGVTINDVVLTVLTRALARYVKLHRQTIAKRFVRIVCPVSLRNGDQSGELGNQISFLPVALPMDVPDPVRMLKAVAARTETMKHAGAAGLVALAASCIAAAPPPMQALFWWALPQVILPFPLLNMICTNVPGSPVPLYAAGRRMLASYPQVPTGYDLGIGCAVQSYDGKLCFGLIADARAGADVNRLRDYLYTAFGELYRAVGIKKARRGEAGPRSKSRLSKPVEPVRAETSEPPLAATVSSDGDRGAPEAPSQETEPSPATSPGPTTMVFVKAAA